MTSEMKLIQTSLDRNILQFRLPGELEKKFKEDFNGNAVESFKTNSAILSVAFLIILLITYFTFDTSLLEEWPYACGVIFISLAGVSILLRIPALDRFFQVYTGILGSLALTASSSIPFFMEGEIMKELTFGTCIFCIVIVYTMAKLLFSSAALWCLLSIGFTVAVLEYFSVSYQLLTFQLNITAAHIFGLTLAYLIEHREKNLFLSTRLLQLEKSEIARMQSLAEKEAQIQIGISHFLNALSADQGLEKFGEEVLRNLASNISFDVASIYFIDQERLYRFGSYALTNDASHRDGRKLNECLLGVSVLKNEIDVLDHFPPESLGIKSGLGHGKACAILMMPIFFDGVAVGGLELGSLSAFEEKDIEFLEGVQAGIGATLNACRNKVIS